MTKMNLGYDMRSKLDYDYNGIEENLRVTLRLALWEVRASDLRRMHTLYE